ncbi:MAG: hypothetical protein MUC59_13725 [Saprospiraceae bacterium]|nr:hypothetical protein [Saprospiraceae bacterium]
MNTEKNFDEQIKQALEKLQANNDGLAWEAFEQRLNLDASDGTSNPTAEGMGSAGRSFDEVVSNALNNVKAPLAASDWSEMEKMIEADEAAEMLENEAQIDNLAFEKLERFEVPFQPLHWQMMSNRLEEEFYLRYHLLRCKAAEVGVMVLLLLTIVRYSPELVGEKPSPTPSTNWPSEKTELLAPSNQAQQAAKPAIAQANTPAAQTRHAAAEGSHFAVSQTIFAAKSGTSKTPPITTETFVATGENSAERLANSQAQLPQLGLTTVQSRHLPTNLFEEIVAKRLLKNSLRTPGMEGRNLGLLASLDAQPIHSKFAWEVPQLALKNFEKDWHVRFSIFTASDIAFVQTPPTSFSVFDTLISAGYGTTLASGYSGGVLASWKWGKWELETGASYSFKRYDPNAPAILIETVNYIIREEKEFDGIQMNVVQVPLNANYHFKNQGKWRIYSSVGASSHFITTTVFKDGGTPPPQPSFAILPTPLPRVSDATTEPSSPAIADERSTDGMFDGGKIKDNFYLTANIGLGMERYVSPRWSLFFQPNYQHQLLSDGVGVNGEKFYNFSFQIGTKVGLK